MSMISSRRGRLIRAFDSVYTVLCIPRPDPDQNRAFFQSIRIPHGDMVTEADSDLLDNFARWPSVTSASLLSPNYSVDQSGVQFAQCDQPRSSEHLPKATGPHQRWAATRVACIDDAPHNGRTLDPVSHRDGGVMKAIASGSPALAWSIGAIMRPLPCAAGLAL